MCLLILDRGDRRETERGREREREGREGGRNVDVRENISWLPPAGALTRGQTHNQASSPPPSGAGDDAPAH